MLMILKIGLARFLGLNLAKRDYKIHSSIALSSSAMSHLASPQPAEHSSMEIDASAIDAAVPDAAIAAAAAALVALPQSGNEAGLLAWRCLQC
jgi:hypothetical protein